MTFLRFTLQPLSWRFAALFVLAHGMAIVCVATVDWPSAVHIGVVLAVLGSLGICLRENVLRRLPGSIVNVLLKNDGSVEVVRYNGETITGKQLPGSFVHPWFTTIRWQANGSRLANSIVVFPGTLPVERFRELRVWLRWHRQSGSDSDH